MNTNKQGKQLSNFEITSEGKISRSFIENNINDFEQAIEFILNLPYGRNANKDDFSTIFADGCATCGTKHAILKQLADENNFTDLKLILGLVKMSASTTPEVAATLARHDLTYIPEAHNYLKYEGAIFDFTKPNFTVTHNTGNILEEIEILPNQISAYKVAYHKNYLDRWLEENKEINFTLDEIWTVREQCIMDLQTNN